MATKVLKTLDGLQQAVKEIKATSSGTKTTAKKPDDIRRKSIPRNDSDLWYRVKIKSKSINLCSPRFWVTVVFIIIICAPFKIVPWLYAYNDKYTDNFKETIRIIKYYDRHALVRSIDKTLAEALIEDKGTGCVLPELDPYDTIKPLWFVSQKENKTNITIECTKNKDWVKCYLSECKVISEILNTTENVTCTYRDILHKDDASYTFGPPTVVKGDAVYTLTLSDHVKINCSGISNTNRSVEKTWSGLTLGFRTTVKRRKLPPGPKKAVNVLILGFDTLAKNVFIRLMPKSHKVLIEELGATMLHGFNIVGDGTSMTLFPVLSGKTEYEHPDARGSHNDSTNFDVKQFIFYKLGTGGYRTAYFEDMPWIGTFTGRLRGFTKQPSDHYLRSFLREEASKSEDVHCIGDTPTFKVLLDITEQYFHLDEKLFCFTFIADVSHDDINLLTAADDDVGKFLRSFKAKGRLNNTLLIVMGDHGPRYGHLFRGQMQGKLEERLPLLAVVLPERLKRARPEAMRALSHNAQVLVTPHDVHATVLDAIGLTQYYNPYKVPGADLKRGLSLLKPIPRNRSCSEAGIEPHWCACLKWSKLSSSDPLYSKSVRALLIYINSLTEPVRPQCAVRYLISTEWVMARLNNDDLMSFRRVGGTLFIGVSNDNVSMYQKVTLMVRMTVGPGIGEYEATMAYNRTEDVFIINSRDISRTSAYGKEPSCISKTHGHLNKYCYCKGYKPR